MDSTGSSRAHPRVLDLDDVRRLGSLLFEASYAEDTLASVLGTRRRGLWRDKKLPLYLRRTARGTPLDVFIRLLTLGLGVDAAEASAAFAPLSLQRLEGMGLVREGVDLGTIESTVAVSPYKGLLLAHDPWSLAVPASRESVPGIASSPMWLDTFTIRRRVASALDVGCGSGIQALLAARHSDRVTAIDINPRAIGFCTFNAALNGSDAVEVLRGDLFEPVKGERFDLIVCNPPYVVSPEREFLYSDGGIGPDGFCQRLMSELPAYLAEGGFACVTAAWPLEDGEDWPDPARRWVEGSGCDVLVLLDGRMKPLTYAASMNSDLVGDTAAYDHKLESWTSAYAEAGIRDIAEGVLILQRRDASVNWVESMSAPPVKGEAGDHLLRMFEGLAASRGRHEDLVQLYPRLADGCEFRERTIMRHDEGPEVRRTIRPSSGIQFIEELSEQEWVFLQRCDGSRSLKELFSTSTWSETGGQGPALEKLRALTRAGMIGLDAAP